MNKDLQMLYHARDVIRRNDSVAQYNNALMDAARLERSPIEQLSKKRVKAKEFKCNSVAFFHKFFTRFLPVLILTGLLLFGLLSLSQTTLSEYIDFGFDTFVEDAREYAIEHVSDFPTLLMGGNLKQYSNAERIAYFQSETFKTDCYTFLTGSVLWMTLGMLVILGLLSHDNIVPLSLPVNILLFLGMVVTLIINVKDVIGVIVGVLWMSITGIPMMWACGTPIMLAFFATNVILTLGASVYGYLAKKHKKQVAGKLASIQKWRAEIAAEESECRAKCASINAKYHKKMRSYPAEFTQLRSFLRNYTTVSQLIWAIENGYATTIDGARVFLDDKAEKAALRKQLSQLQAETQRSYEASLRAEAAALRAEAAAKAPIDVTVTIK